MHWEDMMREDALADARDEGRDEGREQGREQGILSVALEMLRSKLALPIIVQCTNLSESVVRNLAQAHGLAVA